MKRLDYQLLYDFIPVYWKNDSYDELVRQVYLKKYDAVVGDVTITAERSEIVDFTQPFTETGLAIVARTAIREEAHNGWTFLQPFSPALWATTVMFALYTGLVVWLLEHKINPDFSGSSINQVVTLLWFAFSSVLYAHRKHQLFTQVLTMFPLFFFNIAFAYYNFFAISQKRESITV